MEQNGRKAFKKEHVKKFQKRQNIFLNSEKWLTINPNLKQIIEKR